MIPMTNAVIEEAKRELHAKGYPVDDNEIALLYWDGIEVNELVSLYRSMQKKKVNLQAKKVLRPKRKGISKPMRKEVWLMYGGRCAYCGRHISIDDMEIDHRYPLSMGGEDSFKNYMPSCHECNCYKASMTVEGFRNKLLSIQTVLKKNPLYLLGCTYGLLTKEKNNVEFYFETH